MADLKGIVNRPQFDVMVFKPGVPVVLRAKKGIGNCYKIKEANALVFQASPLKISFTVVAKDFHNDCEPYAMDVEITIEQIVDGTYEISLLKEGLS